VTFRDLGPSDDWVAAAETQAPLWPAAQPFYGGPHKFDLEMHEAAFDWLATVLRARQ
jgi:hypothetical protein